MSLRSKFKFYSIANQALIHEIYIRILSDPDPDPDQLFGSGYCKKDRILSDPDPD